MKMDGTERIPAPRDAVWAALNDPRVLEKCIPGCQSLEKVDDTHLKATVQVKMGPVKASFDGEVELQNINAPISYTIRGEGKGGVAGHASGGADVSLMEAGDETELSYDVDAKVGGKIAQVGSRLVDSTARKLAKQFFGNLREHFETA